MVPYQYCRIKMFCRIAEVTTVILAGASPTIPKLLQWFRGRTDRINSRTAYKIPTSSYFKRSHRSDAESGQAWDGSDTTTTNLAKSYIPLADRTRSRDRDSAKEQIPSNSTDHFSAPLDRAHESSDSGGHGQILKTVRIETGFQSH